MKNKNPSIVLIIFGFVGIVLGLIISIFFHHSLYSQLNALNVQLDGSLSALKTFVIAVPSTALVAILFFAIFMQILTKKYTNEISQTKLLLENVLNSLPQRVFWKDAHGRYQGANQAFLNDYNLNTVEDIIGKKDIELGLSKNLANFYKEQDETVIEKNKPLFKLRSEQDLGSLGKIIFEGTKAPLRDKEGRVIGVIGVLEDITKTLTQEAQLIRQNRLAQMGEMISMIAHQWRQPLNIISTTSGAIKIKFYTNKVVESEILEHLECIENQIEHLSITIEDFRNFFKPDSGKSSFTPKDLITDTLKIISPSLENDKIILKTKFDCNPTLNSHRNKLMHVLLNFIKNAQDILMENKKLNPTIDIFVTCKADKTIISVTDNGGGIPEKIIDQIFLPYFSTKTSKNGTGLGLYMSKTIIEEHCDGKLEVANTKEGACFKIIL